MQVAVLFVSNRRENIWSLERRSSRSSGDLHDLMKLQRWRGKQVDPSCLLGLLEAGIPSSGLWSCGLQQKIRMENPTSDLLGMETLSKEDLGPTQRLCGQAF
jgi:hypothetical protein